MPIAGLGGCEEELHILPLPAIEPRSLGHPTKFAILFISVNTVKLFAQLRACVYNLRLCLLNYGSVSKTPGRGPVLGPGTNYTGPREA